MSEIKLTYFNATGRGEISRLILAYANAKYTDDRLTAWPGTLKATLPYQQVPILKYKGKNFAQSITIARFLANEFGLAGRTNEEKAEADEIVDALVDIQNVGYTVIFNKDASKKDQLTTEFKEKFETTLANLEAQLKSRGGQFFAGNQLTWADLQLFNILDFLKTLHPTAVNSAPLLKNLAARVADVPNIKQWVKTRPGQ
jgi:glutathione S-transferase